MVTREAREVAEDAAAVEAGVMEGAKAVTVEEAKEAASFAVATRREVGNQIAREDFPTTSLG